MRTDPTAESPAAAGSRWLALGALRTREYRLLWIGLVVSNVGSWMQLVALSWQIYLLTSSPFFLGLLGLARALPVFLFSLLGGVLADRVDRRRVMIVANSASLLLSGALGALTLAELANIWTVLAIALLSAAAFSFEVPARQSLMPELVPREQMVSAIGLNSVAFNAAAVVGPALAALVINAVGIGGAYLANAASYLAVIVALLFIRSARRERVRPSSGMVGHLLEGLLYVLHSPPVLGLVLSVAVVSLLVRPYTQLMPVFARDVLGGDADALGLLLAASGAGALIGALLVALLGTFPRRGLALLSAAMLLALSLLGFSFSHSLALSAALSAVAGFTSTYYLATTNTMLQGGAPAALRGRIIALYSLVVVGFMPLGGMLLGSLGGLFGVPATLAVASLIALLWTLGVGLALPRLLTLE